MESTQLESRVTSALESLLELFEAELSDVAFPDLGVETLRAADAALHAQRCTVEDAELALQDARRAHEEARRSFERVGRKAIAYALVYADGSPELVGQLETLARDLASAPRSEVSAPVPSAKRRGRPRKSDATLFEPAGDPPAAGHDGDADATQNSRSSDGASSGSRAGDHTPPHVEAELGSKLGSEDGSREGSENASEAA